MMLLRRDGDDPSELRMRAALRVNLWCTRLRSMVVEGLAGAVVALAASGGDGQLELQFVEAGAAVPCSAGDVAVGNSVADTNYHA